MNKLIEFDNVTLSYGRKVVLRSVSFAVHQGDFLGIVGPNGAGKTTLLKAMLGSLKPRQGRISFANPPGGLRFGYVPQRQVVDEAYPLTAMDVAMMGRYGLLGPLRRPGRLDRERVMECLNHAEMAAFASTPYRELSGGQKQRVLIARALAAEPTILVLDEPTTDLDLAGERAIMTLLDHLHKEHSMTVALVSHTLSVVVNSARKIAFLWDSTFEIDDTASAVTSENLSRLYGVPVQVGEVGNKRVVV